MRKVSPLKAPDSRAESTEGGNQGSRYGLLRGPLFRGRVSEVPNGTRRASLTLSQRQKAASSSGGPLC